MRFGATVVAVVVSLPLGLVAARAVAITAGQFFDPCFQWGNGNSASGTISGTIRRDDPCRSRSGASETKTEAIARMLIVPGGILAGLALGILGVARGRAGLAVGGAVVVFLESVPLMFSFGPFAVLTSGAFLLLGRNAGPWNRATRITARALGVVSAIMGLNALRFVAPTVTGFEPGWIMLLFQMAFLFFVSGAAWWPARRAPAG
jgi:hypothetical protein